MTHEDLARHQATISSRASRAVVESMDRARWDKSEADGETVERFLAAINEQLQWISARMSGAPELRNDDAGELDGESRG